MNLYLVKAYHEDDWDKITEFVGCAESEEDVRTINPDDLGYGWTDDQSKIKVFYLGIAASALKKGVITYQYLRG
jgi:hypothetical protein